MGARYPSNQRPEPRQRIDARTPDAKEMGLRNVHRGMSGEVLSGTNETGKAVTFPQAKPRTAAAPLATAPPARPAAAPPLAAPVASGVPVNYKGQMVGGVNYAGKPISAVTPQAAPAPAPAPTAATAPTATAPAPLVPQGMTTGNPNVRFPSAPQVATTLAAQASAGQAQAKHTAVEASRALIPGRRQEDAGILRQPGGAAGGLVTGQGTGARQLTSVFGTGSSKTVAPAAATVASGFPNKGRILDNGTDVTADFAAGGKYSSSPFPKQRRA
jgi:hypothetical protein